MSSFFTLGQFQSCSWLWCVIQESTFWEQLDTFAGCFAEVPSALHGGFLFPGGVLALELECWNQRGPQVFLLVLEQWCYPGCADLHSKIFPGARHHQGWIPTSQSWMGVLLLVQCTVFCSVCCGVCLTSGISSALDILLRTVWWCFHSCAMTGQWCVWPQNQHYQGSACRLPWYNGWCSDHSAPVLLTAFSWMFPMDHVQLAVGRTSWFLQSCQHSFWVFARAWGSQDAVSQCRAQMQWQDSWNHLEKNGDMRKFSSVILWFAWVTDNFFWHFDVWDIFSVYL